MGKITLKGENPIQIETPISGAVTVFPSSIDGRVYEKHSNGLVFKHCLSTKKDASLLANEPMNIVHGLNTTEYLIQIKDSDGTPINISSIRDIDENTVELTHTSNISIKIIFIG